MTSLRITCVQKELVTPPIQHMHVVKVGTGFLPGQVEQYWTVHEVILRIKQGDNFYIRHPVTGRPSAVLPCICPLCQTEQIRAITEIGQHDGLEILDICGK